GWVHTVWLFPISGTNNCTLKKVRPSQRTNDKPHEAWVGLKKDAGDIITAHCSCMAGLGETCSHVAALLFKVEAFHRLELGKASCTSLPCVWNQAFTKQTKPSRAHNIPFIKPKHGKSEATLAEERRIVNRRSFESEIPKVGKNLLDALHTCMANSAVFSVVNGYVEDTAINGFITDEHDVNLPKQLFDLYQHCHSELPESRLLVDTTFSKLKVTQLECDFLEKSTRN
uniref:SWIM-type domain-containing protein n=1 Tax=Amphimedon queenslandica TaxID=400682 RepID=A0A1X7UUJ3_AMPQE